MNTSGTPETQAPEQALMSSTQERQAKLAALLILIVAVVALVSLFAFSSNGIVVAISLGLMTIPLVFVAVAVYRVYQRLQAEEATDN